MSRGHFPQDHFDPDNPSRIDLGPGHWAIKVGLSGYEPTPERPYFGIIEEHYDQDGEICGGFVTFDLPENKENRPKWRVVSWDPLELEPSILCDPKKGGCGMHGHIRGGRWVG